MLEAPRNAWRAHNIWALLSAQLVSIVGACCNRLGVLMPELPRELRTLERALLLCLTALQVMGCSDSRADTEAPVAGSSSGGAGAVAGAATNGSGAAGTGGTQLGGSGQGTGGGTSSAGRDTGMAGGSTVGSAGVSGSG